MNAEYWRSLIDADVPIIPLAPGSKASYITRKDIKSVEDWKKYKEWWTAWTHGRDAISKLNEITENRREIPGSYGNVLEEYDFGLLCLDFVVALDFDSDAQETFKAWLEKMSAEAPSILDRVYMEKSRNGYHVVFRTTMKKSHEVLAKRKSIPGQVNSHGKKEEEQEFQTLIEAIAGSGLLVIAPSSGYTKMRGDLANLPVLTDEEVDTLYRVARSLSKLPPEIEGESNHAPRKTHNYTGWQVCNPVDRYGAEFSLEEWQELLRKCGWRFLRCDDDGRYFYQRPDKYGEPDDHSGDLMFCNGRWTLYTFTANSRLPEKKGISAFKFIQYEACGGDIKKALSVTAKLMCGARLFALSKLCNNR